MQISRSPTSALKAFFRRRSSIQTRYFKVKNDKIQTNLTPNSDKAKNKEMNIIVKKKVLSYTSCLK